jgi:hypothetical protein
MINLVKTQYLNPAVLRITFSDGTQGDYDFAPMLAKETVLTRPLQDPEYFKSGFLELGALCWKNGLEFNAASLHQDLHAAGKLVSAQPAA